MCLILIVMEEVVLRVSMELYIDRNREAGLS